MRMIALSFVMACFAMVSQAAESVHHKGRTIQVGETPASAQCLEQVRKAIDMVEGLPPQLKKLGGTVKLLRCDPPRGSNEVRDNVIGTYTMTSKTDVQGYIDFRHNPASLAPVYYAVSLVTNGIYAGWHRSYVEASRQAAKDSGARDKARRLEALLSRGDLDAVIRAECTILATTRDTLKAFDMPERQITAVSRRFNERNC